MEECKVILSRVNNEKHPTDSDHASALASALASAHAVIMPLLLPSDSQNSKINDACNQQTSRHLLI